MKILSAIAKVVAALAFVAGAVYLVATHGEKIVAWAKKLLPCKDCACDAEEVSAEEPAEEAEVAEEAVEEAVEAPAEDTPVAEEADFEG